MALPISSEVPVFDDDIYEEQCEIASFWSGSRILVMCSMFLYGTFVFAYFYLRAVNNHNDWRVGHQHPSIIIGTVAALCVLVAAGIHYLGARRLQYGARVDWVVGSIASLVLLAISAGLEVWELTRLPFFPASSGYSSIVVTWTPIYIAYLVGSFYWLETLVARAIVAPGEVMIDTPEGPMVVPKFGAKIEGFIVFSGFMALVTVVIWVLFYIL